MLVHRELYEYFEISHRVGEDPVPDYTLKSLMVFVCVCLCVCVYLCQKVY